MSRSADANSVGITVGPGTFDYTYSATVYCLPRTTGWEQFQDGGQNKD